MTALPPEPAGRRSQRKGAGNAGNLANPVSPSGINPAQRPTRTGNGRILPGDPGGDGAGSGPVSLDLRKRGHVDHQHHPRSGGVVDRRVNSDPRGLGGVALELAVTIPTLILVLLAMLEVVVVARLQLELVAAAREGARVAATVVDPAAAVRATQEAVGTQAFGPDQGGGHPASGSRAPGDGAGIVAASTRDAAVAMALSRPVGSGGDEGRKVNEPAGAGSVLAIGAIAVVTFVTIAVLITAQIVTARATATAAADAAALAAAPMTFPPVAGGRSPIDEASTLAGANGARLVSSALLLRRKPRTPPGGSDGGGSDRPSDPWATMGPCLERRRVRPLGQGV